MCPLFSECVVYSVSSLSRCDTVLGVPYAAGPRPTDPGLVLIALWCEVRRARRARLLVSAENRKRTGRRRRKRKERGFSEAARRAPVDAGRSCRGAEMPRGSGTGRRERGRLLMEWPLSLVPASCRTYLTTSISPVYILYINCI